MLCSIAEVTGENSSREGMTVVPVDKNDQAGVSREGRYHAFVFPMESGPLCLLQALPHELSLFYLTESSHCFHGRLPLNLMNMPMNRSHSEENSPSDLMPPLRMVLSFLPPRNGDKELAMWVSISLSPGSAVSPALTSAPSL